MAKSLQSRISIHAPRAGGDDRGGAGKRLYERFQSTPPVRGATLRINPLYYILAISIHAPRAGGDIFISSPSSSGGISIHAPRAGGDTREPRENRAPRAFQSTPPVRGATRNAINITPRSRYFNPRPPCGGRQGGAGHRRRGLPISIHAPRAGGDQRPRPCT